MKINFHKKIAAYFGYEFTRLSKSKFQDQNAHIQALLKHQNINLVLDVGANIGQFGKDLRDNGYTGKIISFEPINNCFQHLNSIADQNWLVQNYALGETESEQIINISNKSVFSSILDVNKYGADKFDQSIRIIDKQKIQIKRLDELLPRLVDNIDDQRIFLKLDTQGYDLKVLEGSSEILEYVYAIQTEVSCKPIYVGSPSYYDSLESVANKGFNITGIFPLSHDDLSMELLEFDCVFTRI